MSDTIESLTIQNRYLASEIERLNNNIEYLDKKLDEELNKSASLYEEVRRLNEDLKAVISCGDKMSIRTGQFACSMHYKAELKNWADLTEPIKNRA